MVQIQAGLCSSVEHIDPPTHFLKNIFVIITFNREVSITCIYFLFSTTAMMTYKNKTLCNFNKSFFMFLICSVPNIEFESKADTFVDPFVFLTIIFYWIIIQILLQSKHRQKTDCLIVEMLPVLPCYVCVQYWHILCVVDTLIRTSCQTLISGLSSSFY